MVAVTEAAAISGGDAVVIQGLGLLGLDGIALARARGGRLVIGLDDLDTAFKQAAERQVLRAAIVP